MSPHVFLWGARAFLVLVALLLVAALAWVFRVFTVTVVQEAVRARRVGNAWAPFEPGAAGDFGPLAGNRWWSVFRAPAHRTSAALAWRWAAWGSTAAVVALASVGAAGQVARLVAHGWS